MLLCVLVCAEPGAPEDNVTADPERGFNITVLKEHFIKRTRLSRRVGFVVVGLYISIGEWLV